MATVANPLRLSEELAIEKVFKLALAYNQLALLERASPRLKDVADVLIEIAELSGKLAEKLSSTDDETRHLLATAGTGIDRYLADWTSDLIKVANVPGLPMPGGTQDEVADFGWVKELNALSEYVKFARSNLFIRKNIADPSAPDKGGNTNLFKNERGSARWTLVNEGWHVFELFKPNMSVGTENGLFHAFMLDVFEYATGLDPFEHSKLLPLVKRAAKTNRRAAVLTKREHELIDKEASIDAGDSKLTPKERRQRHAEVDAKLADIIRERQALWLEQY